MKNKLKDNLTILDYEVKTYKNNNVTSENNKDFQRIESLVKSILEDSKKTAEDFSIIERKLLDEIESLKEELKASKSPSRKKSTAKKTTARKRKTSTNTTRSYSKKTKAFLWRGHQLDENNSYRIVYRPSGGSLESAIFVSGSELVDNDVFLNNEDIISISLDED